MKILIFSFFLSALSLNNDVVITSDNECTAIVHGANGKAICTASNCATALACAIDKYERLK